MRALHNPLGHATEEGILTAGSLVKKSSVAMTMPVRARSSSVLGTSEKSVNFNQWVKNLGI
jgi:hypothetical protein